MRLGFETLTAMENLEMDAEDRPKAEVRITGATVFVNPYKEELEAERQAAEAARLKVGPLPPSPPSLFPVFQKGH